MTLTFDELRTANEARKKEWNKTGIEVPLTFNTNELAGEVGELCNAAKKYERKLFGWPGGADTRENIAEEAADVVICASLVALKVGFDLGEAVRRKFDSTSRKHGFKTMLQRPSLQRPADDYRPADSLSPRDPPPEGRTVEEKQRVALKDDVYWINGGWIKAVNDHSNTSCPKHYCLRPLPAKPVGDGWEWRRPKDGDKIQVLRADGEPSFVGTAHLGVSWDVNDPGGRKDYRWCREVEVPTQGDPIEVEA